MATTTGTGSYDGTFTITGVTSADSFTYSLGTTAGMGESTGGTATGGLTGTVTDLLVDPTNSYTAYVTTTTGQIWKTTDAGYYWVNIGQSPVVSNQTPESPINADSTGPVPGAVWTIVQDPRTDTVVPSYTIASAGLVDYSITSATDPAKTATITTSVPLGLVVGEKVTVAGMGVMGYNGTETVTGVFGTSFTYQTAGTLADSSGGTVTGPTVALVFNSVITSITAGETIQVAGVGTGG